MPWPRADDRRLLATSLALLTLLAWWALWRGEHSQWGHAVLHAHGARPAGENPLTFGIAFVLGWTVMTIAMMLPTSSPLVLLFQTMAGARPDSYRLVALVIGGYLAVWTLFGLVAYLLYQAAEVLFGITEQPWIAGSLILLGLILSNTVAPAWILLTWFVGSGLTFAGITGFCGMARLLAVMPWNKVSV